MGRYLSTLLKAITAPCWREMVLNQLLGSSTAHWPSHVSVSERVNFCSLTINDEENANNIPSYDRPQGTLPVQHLICSAARTGKSSWTQLVSFCLFLAYLFLFPHLWVLSPSFPMAVFPPSLPVHVNCSAVTLSLCTAVRVPHRWLLPTPLAV